MILAILIKSDEYILARLTGEGKVRSRYIKQIYKILQNLYINIQCRLQNYGFLPHESFHLHNI